MSTYIDTLNIICVYIDKHSLRTYRQRMFIALSILSQPLLRPISRGVADGVCLSTFLNNFVQNLAHVAYHNKFCLSKKYPLLFMYYRIFIHGSRLAWYGPVMKDGIHACE